MAGERQSIGWLTRQPIAHRGLHDAARGVPENSLAAFRAAMERGYAIECDLHLSCDHVPMVFHDHDLGRLTEATGPLATRTAAELGALALGQTGETIPTLRSLLDLVAGRVPLVVELKGRSPEADAGFADALRPLVERYEGPLALMSFDDWLVDQALAFRDRLPVGLTAEGKGAEALETHRTVYERGCAFTSYNVHHLPNAFVDWVRDAAGGAVISWTVRSLEQQRHSASHADQITFEGFVPQS